MEDSITAAYISLLVGIIIQNNSVSENIMHSQFTEVRNFGQKYRQVAAKVQYVAKKIPATQKMYRKFIKIIDNDLHMFPVLMSFPFVFFSGLS